MKSQTTKDSTTDNTQETSQDSESAIYSSILLTVNGKSTSFETTKNTPYTVKLNTGGLKNCTFKTKDGSDAAVVSEYFSSGTNSYEYAEANGKPAGQYFYIAECQNLETSKTDLNMLQVSVTN